MVSVGHGRPRLQDEQCYLPGAGLLQARGAEGAAGEGMPFLPTGSSGAAPVPGTVPPPGWPGHPPGQPGLPPPQPSPPPGGPLLPSLGSHMTRLAGTEGCSTQRWVATPGRTAGGALAGLGGREEEAWAEHLTRFCSFSPRARLSAWIVLSDSQSLELKNIRSAHRLLSKAASSGPGSHLLRELCGLEQPPGNRVSREPSLLVVAKPQAGTELFFPSGWQQQTQTGMTCVFSLL